MNGEEKEGSYQGRGQRYDKIYCRRAFSRRRVNAHALVQYLKKPFPEPSPVKHNVKSPT
jgi:hypothetical protein